MGSLSKDIGISGGFFSSLFVLLYTLNLYVKDYSAFFKKSSQALFCSGFFEKSLCSSLTSKFASKM